MRRRDRHHLGLLLFVVRQRRQFRDRRAGAGRQRQRSRPQLVVRRRRGSRHRQGERPILREYSSPVRGQRHGRPFALGNLGRRNRDGEVRRGQRATFDPHRIRACRFEVRGGHGDRHRVRSLGEVDGPRRPNRRAPEVAYDDRRGSKARRRRHGRGRQRVVHGRRVRRLVGIEGTELDTAQRERRQVSSVGHRPLLVGVGPDRVQRRRQPLDHIRVAVHSIGTLRGVLRQIEELPGLPERFPLVGPVPAAGSVPEDELPRSVANREGGPGGMLDCRNLPLEPPAPERVQQGYAVLGDARGEAFPHDIGQRRVQVRQRHSGVADRLRRNHCGPPRQQRHPVAAFVDVALDPAPVAVRPVAVRPVAPDFVVIRMVQRRTRVAERHARTVVRSEDHQRVVARADGVKLGQHLADGPVDLSDVVAIAAHAREPLEAGRRNERFVRRRQREEEEERGLVRRRAPDEVERLVRQAVEHVERVEQHRRRGRLRQEHAGVGRVVGRRQRDEPIVADENVGTALDVPEQSEKLVEAPVDRPVGDAGGVVEPPVPPRRFLLGEQRKAHADVPLANGGGAIAVRPHQGAERGPVGRDQRPRLTRQDVRFHPRPPRVAPGEEPVARRRAHGGGRVRVGEAHALGGDAVDVGRGNARLRTHGSDIPPAEVIGQDDDDVRRGRRGSRTRPGRLRSLHGIRRHRGGHPRQQCRQRGNRECC